MEESTFDLLLRKASEQTTRRETLAALVSSAVLLGAPETGEATRKGERRKRRRRRERHQNQAAVDWRTPIVMLKSFSDNHVIVSSGSSGPLACCTHFEDRGLGHGDFISVSPGLSHGLWIYLQGKNGKYWFQFTNPLIGKPWIEVGLNGRPRSSQACCHVIPYGISIEGRKGLKEWQVVRYDIAGPRFTVVRKEDSKLSVHFELRIESTI